MITRSLIFLVVTGLLSADMPEQAVEKTVKLVMNHIGTAHHDLVDLSELLVEYGVEMKRGVDGHRRRRDWQKSRVK